MTKLTSNAETMSLEESLKELEKQVESLTQHLQQVEGNIELKQIAKLGTP